MATARQIVEAKIKKWQEANTEGSIAARVNTLLNNARDNLIFQMAGFKKGWHNDHEIDTSPYRTNHVWDYIEKVSVDAVREWISANMKDLPEPTDGMKELALEEYKKIYKRELGRRSVSYTHLTLPTTPYV